MNKRVMREVQQSMTRDRPLGSYEWTARMAARLGLEQTLRNRGRPLASMETLSPRTEKGSLLIYSFAIRHNQ